MGCKLERVWQMPSPALSRSLPVSARPWVQILAGEGEVFPARWGKDGKNRGFPCPGLWAASLGAGTSREVLIIASSNSWESSSNARGETEALRGEVTFPRCLSCLGTLPLESTSEPGGAAPWFSIEP